MPLMNFWSEIEEKSLGIYPESDWLYQLNNIKSKTDLVKTCLDYGTLDVLVLAVSKRSTSLWAYENLKVTNKEGINFPDLAICPFLSYFLRMSSVNIFIN